MGDVTDPEGVDRLPGRGREARENDVALFQAAREVFATDGYDAPMSRIAAHAGIGVGGIYRRYANKDALIYQLRVHALERVIACARAAAEDAPDGGATTAFLMDQVEAADVPVSSALNSRMVLTDDIRDLSEELHVALESLLAIDRERGLIPDGFSAGDLLVTLAHVRSAVSGDRDLDRALNRRHLDYVLRGIRTSIEDPVTAGRGTTWADWMRLNSRADA